MSAKSTLDALIAANAPAPVAPVVTAPVDRRTTVKNGKVSTTTSTLAVDGYALNMLNGLPQSVKDAIARNTANPWYLIVEYVAMQTKPCYIEITRPDGSKAKSPVSKLDSAIQRARKLGVVNHGKLDAKSGTQKGVWYLMRRP
jgi:hypothetical protein